MALAEQEAIRLKHNFMSTEHVLLGIIRLHQGVAVNVMQRMGLKLETIAMELEKQVGVGQEPVKRDRPPYTPRVKKVFALAAQEQQAFNHTCIGTEHILLGLLREGDGVAARVLANLDIKLDDTRKEVLKELDPDFEP